MQEQLCREVSSIGALSIRIAIVVGLSVLFAGLAQAQDPHRPAVGGIGSPTDAMIFYVAHGTEGACGPGCSEWIAAEGTVQWDTHKRLIAILDRQTGRKLPVVIRSWGSSNLNVATSLGRILRSRGIDTTAGSTAVPACDGKSETECFALKRPGGRLDAKLNVPDAPCDLACVLTLLGGVHRSLPAGTTVVLSGMEIRNRLAPNVSEERRQGLTVRFGELYRIYLRDMGVETELLDIVDRNSESHRQTELPPSEWLRLRIVTSASLQEPHDTKLALQQPEIAQLAAHRFRHRRDAGGGRLGQVGRCRVVGQIAPTLEGAHRSRRNGEDLGLHHDATASDAVLVAERLDRDDLFAGGDFTLDHPVDRASREQFGIALRHHPRDVDVTQRQALFLGRGDTFGDKALELFDGLAANGKLDEMKRHDWGSFSGPRGL